DAYAMAFPASGVVPRTTEIGAKRTRAGSVGAEIASYLASADFAKNEPVTQKDYRRFLEGIRHYFGDFPIATVVRKHVVAMVDRMKDTPSEARNFLKVLSVVCKHAVNRGMLEVNPCAGVKVALPKDAGHLPWTEEKIDIWENAYPVGTKQRLAS